MFYGDVFKVLNKARVKYVVAGGVAVTLHGYMRYTNDVDLIVHLEETNLDKMFDSFLKIGYQPKAPVTKEQFKDKKTRKKLIKEKGMLVFSFYHNNDPFKTIDIFAEEPIDFDQLYKNRIKVKLENTTVPVISLDHLRTLKKRANRPQDKIDMTQLDAIKKFNRKTSQ